MVSCELARLGSAVQPPADACTGGHTASCCVRKRAVLLRRWCVDMCMVAYDCHLNSCIKFTRFHDRLAHPCKMDKLVYQPSVGEGNGRCGRDNSWRFKYKANDSLYTWNVSYCLFHSVQPGSSKPNHPNPGLSRNLPVSVFVNMTRILYQNACIAKLKTRRTTLVFLHLKTCSLLDHKSRWRISLIGD